MNRATFLVDGFNIYHSAKAASRDLGGASTRWLDLGGLLTSYLSVVGQGAQLKDIYYFTALARHMDARKPGTTARHKLYMECLRATGVRIEVSRFKYKDVWCDGCRKNTAHYEEKETDVAISVKLLEIFSNDECDTGILVTGDTDLAPAIEAASRMFPEKTVCVAFPYKRKNNELAKLVATSFRIKIVSPSDQLNALERYAAEVEKRAGDQAVCTRLTPNPVANGAKMVQLNEVGGSQTAK